MHKNMLSGGVSLIVMILIGCESYNRPFDPKASLPRTDSQNSAAGGYRPLAYVDGDPIYVSEMLPMLLEISGGPILSELILDRMIEDKLGEQDLTLTKDMIESEKRMMLGTLSDDPDQAALMLSQLRQRRGLGNRRFEALIRRNAGLRLLIQPRVNITPADLREGFELQYGPRFESRIIVTDRISDAKAVQQRIVAGDKSFADLATEYSTDISAYRGGLLSPISPSDPTYPKTIRDVLMQMQPGEVSEIIIVENGYALLRLERIIDSAAPEFSEVREQVAQSVRMAEEKLLMQQLARELIAKIKLITLDPALNQSWQYQRRQLLQE